MRSILVSACALLLLSGCGRNSSDPPQAATSPSPDGTNRQKKEAPAVGNPDTNAQTQANPPTAAGPGFAADDPQQTLRWLIRSAAKLRATPPGDKAALDREWADYTRAVKSADGQKIRWELAVDEVTPKEVTPLGVITETVKSPDDPACSGLRLKPDKQPAGFTTFILEMPTAGRPAELRPGSRVLVTGTVARIETDLRKSRPNAPTYGFNVRLTDYSVSPIK